MDFIDICRQFIAIDSSPSVGNFEAAQFAAKIARSWGLSVEVQEENHNGSAQANVIIRTTDSRPDREFMLQTHLDTVDPGNFALWTKTGANPFNASIYQEAIYGLGTAEVKLDFLCKLRALAKLKDENFKIPPVIVGTYGEEIGMAGAVKLLRKKKVNATLALVGEPTEMRLLYAGKGFAAVDVEIPFSKEELEFRREHDTNERSSSQSKIFLGKSAHSSSPQHGESAILKMLEYLSKLPDGIAVMDLDAGVNFNTVPSQGVLEFDMAGGLKDTIAKKITHLSRAIEELEKDFLKYPDSAFIPEYPTLNIGMIRTHDDHIKLSGCCRIPPSVNQETYERWMQQLRLACEATGSVFRVTEYKQPFRSNLDSPFARACQEQLEELGLPTECGTQSVTNEANVFSRLGIECLVIGPGQGVGNSHSPEEHVKLSQLDAATDFYVGIMKRIGL